VRRADGRQKILSAMLATSWPHARLLRQRGPTPLEKDFGNVVAHSPRTSARRPLCPSTRNNLERCATIVGDNRWDLLDGSPITTTRELDPRYRAEVSSSGPH